jgi:NAD(P)-dependent dehydrogenase (short-subunit alcohol dehydrogenase family)
VVLVTGGGSGIGRAICRAAAAAGAAVAVSDINPVEADRTRLELEAAGSQALSLTLDVRHPEECSRCVQQAAAWNDRLDLLVNCAGVYPSMGLLDASEEHWDLVLDTNLKGTFFMVQAFARVLIAAGRPGAVVNMASRTGVRASGRLPAYSTSKAGVISLTESAAQELGPHRIRVNGVAPGPILPPLGSASGEPDPQYRDRMVQIPLGRFGRAEEVAAGVVFLLSDRASLATGTTLILDGGALLP